MRIHGLVALIFALTAVPVLAQSNDIGVWYSTAQIKDTGNNEARLSFDDATGYGVSFNHFWTYSVSTDFAVQRLESDAGIDIGGTRAINAGTIKLMPVTANLQWHFFRGAMVSPYIGAGVAYVKADDLSSSDLDLANVGTIKFDNKTSWDANAGLNIGIGRAFAIAVDAKYIKYEPTGHTATETAKLKLNPVVLSAGVKLRF